VLFRSATSIAEIYRENEEYELLAIHYHNIENIELRDKYIEKVLSENPSDDSVLFLKSLQARGNEVSKEIIDRQVRRYKAEKDWLQIARIYKQVDDPIESVKFYLKGVSQVFADKNYFTSAFYLKELVEDGLIDHLFSQAFIEAKEQGDLWWQVRALQELGWNTELSDLVIENRENILHSNDLRLLQLLAEIEGNDEEYINLIKMEANSTHIFPDDTIGFTDPQALGESDELVKDKE